MVAVDELFLRSITILWTIYFVAGVAAIVGLVFFLRVLVRAYLEYHGKRLVRPSFCGAQPR